MSNYAVIASVSERLRQMLWESINADPIVRPLVGSESAIVFKNPTETARDQSNRLSIWLYQITENEHVKNQPEVRLNDDANRFPPLSLNLYYLVTPFAASSDGDHLLLGRTLGVMYDNAVLPLRDAAGGVMEELRIILCNLTLEELTRIWEALREPYRLSVCYQVRVAHIDSERQYRRRRVTDRTARYQSVPNPDEAEGIVLP